MDLKAKPAGCLGGKGDWEDLMDYAGRNGITIYPAVDNQTFSSGSGYYTFTDTTVRISGSYARIYPYNLAYGNQSSAEKPLSLLSPAAFSEIYEKLTGNFTKKNLSAVSLGSMTSALYGDYGKKEICRDKAQEILTQSYQQITDADIAMLADTANAYALPYVQELTDVPSSPAATMCLTRTSRSIRWSCTAEALRLHRRQRLRHTGGNRAALHCNGQQPAL